MNKKIKNLIMVIGTILVIVGLGYWMYRRIANLPGIVVNDQGRDHKPSTENDKFVYNSYPPTSGPHDVEWIKPGVYNSPQDKYKLIHSLEHGYIVIHYNCATTECELGKTLSEFGNKMGMKKLIVTIDPQIKFPVVLTAWNRILEMKSFDEKLATNFVNSFRGKGPELTME
ncbi:DUF3105 domain-containing protein [Candidatus Amesbacteria bacterium]|nr:DUF3105 domain-containing protein [Candidatus Amesbacteria bacterium]